MIPLLANAGTPLMWLSFFHLVVGNALIAFGEATLLRLFWTVPQRAAFTWMLVANYVTMAAGLFAVGGVGRRWAMGVAAPHDALTVLATAGVALFAFTVLAEWTFVARALAGRFRPTWRALRVSFVLQAASYAVLVPIYMTSSTIAAIAQTTPTEPAAIARELSARIYYIADDETVRSVALDGTGDRDEGGGADASRCRIVAEPDSRVIRVYDEEKGETIWSVGVDGRIDRLRDDMGLVPAANPSGDERWRVVCGSWAVEGLMVTEEETGERYSLGLETPFVAWPSRCATLLPGGRVVYALGPHIVLLDLSTRRVAHIGRGRSPVVVLEDSE